MSYKLVPFIALLCTVSTLSAKTELQLDRFEQETGFDLVNVTGLRVRKFNRTTWILEGEGDMFRDIGDEYWFTLTVAYSRLGNNQFNEYPLKISKRKTCDIINGPYKEYQPYFVNWTSFPRVFDERVCPLPKGHYWVKEFAPEAGWIPPVFPDGYWRLTGDVLDSEDIVMARYVGYMHIKKGFL